MRKAHIVVAAAGALVILFTGVAGASTRNDRVLDESKYTEVFKKEGKDKNYLYTITTFTDDFGRACTVVTGASETAIAMQCGAAGKG